MIRLKIDDSRNLLRFECDDLEVVIVNRKRV